MPGGSVHVMAEKFWKKTMDLGIWYENQSTTRFGKMACPNMTTYSPKFGQKSTDLGIWDIFGMDYLPFLNI